jgi:hypothetical protein
VIISSSLAARAVVEATGRVTWVLWVLALLQVNDIPSLVARKDSAREFADMIVDAYEEQRRQSQDQPLVMGLALHPYLVSTAHVTLVWPRLVLSSPE